MTDTAEFRAKRSEHLISAGLASVMSAAMFGAALTGTEDRLLQSRPRRGGGIVKLIEQTIGWDLFVMLMLTIGIVAAVASLYFAVLFAWTTFDRRPDVRALQDRVEFHPALKASSTTYDQVLYWAVANDHGFPALVIHLKSGYWSFKGLLKRKTIRLEDKRERLEPLIGYFLRHPGMSAKFARR